MTNDFGRIDLMSNLDETIIDSHNLGRYFVIYKNYYVRNLFIFIRLFLTDREQKGMKSVCFISIEIESLNVAGRYRVVIKTSIMTLAKS